MNVVLTEARLLNIGSIIPNVDMIEKIYRAQLEYEAHKSDAAWCKKHFMLCPWGIAWNVSPKGHKPSMETALAYFLCAILLKWSELQAQLQRTLKSTYSVTQQDLRMIRGCWLDNDLLDAAIGVFKDICTKVDNEYANKATTTNEDLSERDILHAIDILSEDIEKHDELNPKLFGPNNKLKDEVREKIIQIVNEFSDELENDGIELIADDIVLIGSNVSYNYTKDSDLDIHIKANTHELRCPADLAGKLYSAYRSLFNKNFKIDFYGIPVELFVETEDIATVSNGIYSVMQDEWIKEPKQEDIPEIDTQAFNAEFDEWEQRYEAITEANPVKRDELDSFIEDIYELRKTSITKDGEYSIGNLVFKELRNRGYLDNLKDLKREAIASELSLESLKVTYKDSNDLAW